MKALRALQLLTALMATQAVGLEHVYDVRVADDLSSVAVRAKLVGAVRALQAREGSGARMSDLGGCAGESLAVGDDRIVLPDSVTCLTYRAMLGNEAGRGPEPASGVVVSAPDRWLWEPADPHLPIRINLDLPPHTRASVPWRDSGGGVYHLDPSPRSSRAVAVFGSFALRYLSLPGADLRVALIDSPQKQLDEEKVLAWLEAAANDVVGVSGRFPNPALQVIVQPSERGRSAVPFGYVIRNGGESVRFFVAAQRPLADYLNDWTATHEFSHLLLPYVRAEQKWISEGFASYYQNVLLARRGVYTEVDAWRRLLDAFSRAAGIANPPALNDVTERPFREMRMLIYWSGAAIALMADTRLRELSAGRESLDTVLAGLQACCLPATGAWTGERLFAKLDALSSQPVFMDLYRQHADANGMPDLAAYYASLGIARGESGVTLDDRAPLAHVRRAIMAPAVNPPGGVPVRHCGDWSYPKYSASTVALQPFEVCGLQR